MTNQPSQYQAYVENDGYSPSIEQDAYLLGSQQTSLPRHYQNKASATTAAVDAFAPTDKSTARQFTMPSDQVEPSPVNAMLGRSNSKRDTSNPDRSTRRLSISNPNQVASVSEDRSPLSFAARTGMWPEPMSASISSPPRTSDSLSQSHTAQQQRNVPPQSARRQSASHAQATRPRTNSLAFAGADTFALQDANAPHNDLQTIPKAAIPTADSQMHLEGKPRQSNNGGVVRDQALVPGSISATDQKRTRASDQPARATSSSSRAPRQNSEETRSRPRSELAVSIPTQAVNQPITRHVSSARSPQVTTVSRQTSSAAASPATRPMSGEASKVKHSATKGPARRSAASSDPSDWAADRSPLQRLEVKLNDISKEEKRARVQEAEQRLRDRQARQSQSLADSPKLDRGKSHRSTTRDSRGDKYADVPDRYNDIRSLPLDRNESRRSSGPARHETRQNKTATRPIFSDVEASDRQSSRRVASGPAAASRQYQRDEARAPNGDRPSQSLQAPQTYVGETSDSDDVAEEAAGQPLAGSRRRVEDQMSRSPSPQPELRRRSTAGDREVRFNSEVQNIHVSSSPSPEPTKPSRRFGSFRSPGTSESRKGQRLSGTFSASSPRADENGNDDDPVPRHAVMSQVNELKYEIPPQTAAGIEARQKIGFGSRTNDTNLPTGRKHHLSDLFHRTGPAPHSDAQVPNRPTRHLDEWRQGGTARLAVADKAIVIETPRADPNTAWWDNSRAGKTRQSDASAEQNLDIEEYDGTRDNASQSESSPFLPSSLQRRPTIATDPDTAEPIRARQRIGYDGTMRVKRRNRTFRLPSEPVASSDHGSGHAQEGSEQSHGSRHSRFLHRDANSPSFPSPRAFYDFYCPDPQSHDPHQKGHLCDPHLHLKKKLTTGMRDIRVRIPAAPTHFEPPLLLKCGPLLRYNGLRRNKLARLDDDHARSIDERETWRGSILIVTEDVQSTYQPVVPTLRLFHQELKLLPEPPRRIETQDEDADPDEGLPAEYVDPVAGLPKLSRTGGVVYVKPVEDLDEGQDVSRIENDDGLYEETRTANVPTAYGKADELLGRSPVPGHRSGQGRSPGQRDRTPKRQGRYREVRGVRLHAERGLTFWRFNIEVELGDTQQRIAYSINKGASTGFWVPARGETMNIMFHSCNGFSMGVDPHTCSGPDPLWRDVLNAHQYRPFHVMLGGGDQVYNDAVMMHTRLFREWLETKNPMQKHETEFSAAMQEELEVFYLERYCMWFSQGLFGMANAQIPMVNIWDDHDIIDGFGSYPHSFMSTPVFCGLGNVAFKYYMLFQQQSVVDEVTSDEPSWLLGASPGPYINEFSRSLFMFLGKRVAFLGLDCRTERMRDEIISEATYDLVFERLHREIIRGETKHLIVLLGVPIAYPRLVWLENVLTSRALDPLKALGRLGLLGNVMNKFDGGVEILDDLDDHWTARNHKEERNWFVEELQELAAEKSVRITILSGDVHLGAVGQFFSSKRAYLPKDQDFRYMPNVISSAIVNTPPPDMMADVLNKRNKVHHLNAETDEDMIPMFTHDVDGKQRNNKRLLPKRNWCSITEYQPGDTPPPTPPSLSPSVSNESLERSPPRPTQRRLSLTRADFKPSQLIRRLSLSQRDMPSADDLTPDEEPPQTAPMRLGGQLQDSANSASASRPTGQFLRRPTNMSERAAAKGGADDDNDHVDLEYGLDVSLNFEIKQGDPSGSTEPYRLLVPTLTYDGEPPLHGVRHKSLIQRLSSRHSTQRAATFHDPEDGRISPPSAPLERKSTFDQPEKATASPSTASRFARPFRRLSFRQARSPQTPARVLGPISAPFPMRPSSSDQSGPASNATTGPFAHAGNNMIRPASSRQPVSAPTDRSPPGSASAARNVSPSAALMQAESMPVNATQSVSRSSSMRQTGALPSSANRRLPPEERERPDYGRYSAAIPGRPLPSPTAATSVSRETATRSARADGLHNAASRADSSTAAQGAQPSSAYRDGRAHDMGKRGSGTHIPRQQAALDSPIRHDGALDDDDDDDDDDEEEFSDEPYIEARPSNHREAEVSDAEDSLAEEQDSVDQIESEYASPVPQRIRGSGGKFDRNGVSAFFGGEARPRTQVVASRSPGKLTKERPGPYIQRTPDGYFAEEGHGDRHGDGLRDEVAQYGVDRGVPVTTASKLTGGTRSRRASAGYDGIEAYDDRRSSWRKFF